jgi:hypothetical protein
MAHTNRKEDCKEACAAGKGLQLIGFMSVFSEQLAGGAQNLFCSHRAGEKSDALSRIVGGLFVSVSQNQHRQKRHSCAQFFDKGRAAYSRHVMSGDDQAEIAGKLGLLDETESLDGVRNSAHVSEFPLQERLTKVSLKRVVVHQ